MHESDDARTVELVEFVSKRNTVNTRRSRCDSVRDPYGR